MELMSMLLLLAIWLPQTLGVKGIYNSDNKLNSSIIIENSVSTRNRNRHLITNPSNQAITQVQAVLNDDSCKDCITCMRRILLAQNDRSKYILSNLHPDELYPENLLGHLQNYRYKRSIRSKRNISKLDIKTEDNKSSVISITKYKNEDKKIYAIKVNETSKHTSNDAKSSCKVYSVKKTFPCGTEESDLILAKRKINKKGKKPKDKNSSSEKPKPATGVFKKREVRIENSQVPESFMPSIEELY